MSSVSNVASLGEITDHTSRNRITDVSHIEFVGMKHVHLQVTLSPKVSALLLAEVFLAEVDPPNVP